MKVLFLYTELADYFLKCCAELAKTAEVHVIRWPVNKEAPFSFDEKTPVKLYNRRDYDLEQMHKLAAEIQPDILICSGWIDRDYLKVARRYYKKIPTVVTCDTHWKGSLKQYLALFLSRFFLLNTFSHAWVPGKSQYRYVRKLGFKNAAIREGFYCCDLPKFNALYERIKPEKEKNIPKRFIYVGRYYEFKGLTDLWEAFSQLQQESPSEWELWCLGTGSLDPVRHPAIKHHGFVQPADLDPLLAETGVFVLPSRFEPWGVVVQEYAAAGFPLILSDAVGAKDRFLEPGQNGYIFEKENITALKEVLKKITKLSPKDLLLMSEKSHRLAQQINPAQWAGTVSEIYDGFRKK